ncbi:hypothetical protein PV325_008409 [Microctonus aethiopoides]|nr:hypothetical protein PV325_008409 [Microctonus aethiopoides]KAK0098739.1 hypothetical protein PV326_004632 [Microctonus aethiopoides]
MTYGGVVGLIFVWGLYFGVIFNNLSANSTDILKKTSPIYAIAINTNILANISLCKSELDLFRDGVDKKKLWSLKNANGEPKPGFIYGNRFWLGNKKQCYDIENRLPFEINKIWMKNNLKFHNNIDDYPPFNLNYIVSYIRHNSTIQYYTGFPNEDVISLALCLPASCTRDEISEILKYIFQERLLTVGNLYDADFNLIYINDFKNDHQWLINWRIITVGFVIILTWLMMILGTVYDIIIHQKRFKMNKLLRPTTDKNIEIVEQENYLYDKRPSIFAEIILCFSIYTNTKFIFHTKNTSDSINAIHGLRFLGMVWIIMIHSVLFMSDYVDNRVWSMRMSEGIIAQIISNGTFSVDTFFLISGFLLAWIYFKDRKKMLDNKKIINCIKWNDFFNGIAKRIVRLTPSYMILLGIVEINFGWYSKTSLFYMNERPHDTCAKYWWRNLLLDMQWNMLDIFYYPPWMRIGPYLIGIITAYSLTRINKKLCINKKFICLMWIVGSLCNILTLFGLFKRDISVTCMAIYVALSRSVWAIGISWLIIACYTNNGGIINKILTLNLWIPLSRLTYCAYLINPLIINSIYLQSETSIHVDFLPNVIIFLGELIITYICAFIMTLMAEIPYTLLLKLLMKSRNNNKY